MTKNNLRAILKYLVDQDKDGLLAKATEKLGEATMVDLLQRGPSLKINIPSLQTQKHALAVVYVKSAFKSVDEFKTKEGKKKAEKIAKTFGCKKYQIKKMFVYGKWMR